jgi:hypothetical protein|tara:strand:+ start:43 stop:219 length:177 start_codon:yes stop_codon:yes gene_type:complete
MKIKIGTKIYDAEKEPIMLILTDQDKSNIKNMLPECSKFVIFPDNCDKQEISKWAETE